MKHETGPFKLLVIDDDRALCRLYEWELGKEGYALSFASTGWEGVEMARKESPDLVILDILMGGMDGLATLTRLLEDDAGRPVVINSAYGSYRDNFMSWAADAYLTKSADFSDLKETIRFLLEERSRRDGSRASPDRRVPGRARYPNSEIYLG